MDPSTNVNYFDDATLPDASDSSDLSNILVQNYQSEEEFESLFTDLKEGQIPDVEFNERSKIFSEVLPINFLNHLSLVHGKYSFNSFFTPSQRFVIKYIQRTLLAMKGHEHYNRLLNYFANHMIPRNEFNPTLFRFCGEVTLNRSKKIALITCNDQIEIYEKNNLYTLTQTIPASHLPKQSKSWEQTRAEIENGIYSPLIAVFRSFSSLNGCDILPVEVYSGFINYITSPDMSVSAQLLAKNVDEIEIPLLTIFMHKNLHRRLLKYCIYQDVFSTDDASHLMRKNSKEVKIVVHFLSCQMQGLIDPAINRIKEAICSSIDIDFTLTDEETVNSVKRVASIFIDGFISILPIISSAIRFVCCIINEACTLRFKSFAFKGIFMAFFFRVIFPILCQPRETDPPGLNVDVKKMEAFGKVMTSIFLNDHASFFSEIDKVQQDKVNFIYDRLIQCDEPYDVIEQPSFKLACQMVDRIRKMCKKMESDLVFDYSMDSQILVHWLDLLTMQN